MRVSTLSDEPTPAKWREMPSETSPSTMPHTSSLQTAFLSTLLFRR
tara:strand:- start:386 stop:523 length:138 start_codon:yes stop_codon:yes gene_type:complete